MPKSIYEEFFFALHLILRGKLEVDGREVLLRSENMLKPILQYCAIFV